MELLKRMIKAWFSWSFNSFLIFFLLFVEMLMWKHHYHIRFKSSHLNKIALHCWCCLLFVGVVYCFLSLLTLNPNAIKGMYKSFSCFLFFVCANYCYCVALLCVVEFSLPTFIWKQIIFFLYSWWKVRIDLINS